MLHAVNSFSPAVYCTDDNDTIRIFGSNPEKGMLQVCKDGIWHAVCDSRWNCNDAKVACRELGFTEGRVGKSSTHYQLCTYFHLALLTLL